jgi:hypothetical protein
MHECGVYALVTACPECVFGPHEECATCGLPVVWTAHELEHCSVRGTH